MIIEIKGVQFVNKGAELMLQAILKKITEHNPEWKICLAPNKNSPYLKRAEVNALQKVTFRKNIIDLNWLFYLIPKKIRAYFLNSWGLVTEADVDVILDASGFAYGDQWSDLVLQQTAQEVRRFKRKNKKYIFMPQALGPFTRNVNKKWAKIAFENAALTFARESISFSEVNNLLPNLRSLYQAPDFTNLILGNDFVPNILEDAIAIIPNSKMLSSKNKNKEWQVRYIPIFVFIIQWLQRNGEMVYLLNHEGSSDGDICIEINKELECPLPIFSPKNALEVKSFIGKSKFIVCSRYHGCVSALTQLVPCISTSWSHKYEELFDEYHLTHLLLKSDATQEEIDVLLNYLHSNYTKEKQQLLQYAELYKALSSEMWGKILATIS